MNRARDERPIVGAQTLFWSQTHPSPGPKDETLTTTLMQGHSCALQQGTGHTPQAGSDSLGAQKHRNSETCNKNGKPQFSSHLEYLPAQMVTSRVCVLMGWHHRPLKERDYRPAPCLKRGRESHPTTGVLEEGRYTLATMHFSEWGVSSKSTKMRIGAPNHPKTPYIPSPPT